MVRTLHLTLVVAVLVSTVGVAVIAAQPAPDGADWPQARHDAGRTGFNPSATGPRTDVGPDWVTRVGSGGVGEVSPTVVGGTVYVGNNDGELYAFDAESGNREWRTEVGPHVRSAAAVGTDHVYVVVEGEEFGGDEVVAVERSSGEVDWRYTPDHPDTPAAWLRGQPVVANGHVYVAGNVGGPNLDPTGVVTALDPASGETDWRRELTDDFEQDIATTPAVANGQVYVFNHPYAEEGRNGTLYALDAASGDVTWNTSVAPLGWTVLATDDRVYVAGRDTYAVDATSGTVLRSYGTDSPLFTPPAVANGTLYYPAGVDYAADRPDPTAVAAMDTATGEEVWRTQVGWVETPPAVSSELVVVGTIDGELYALDRSDGSVVWQYTVDERLGVDSAPAIVGDTVYLGPDPWHVYAFRDGGTATKGGTVGAIGEWLRDNPAAAFLVIGLLGGTFTGLLVGGVSLPLLRNRVSNSPQRILAGKLFRTPYESVTGTQRAVAHLLAAVAVAVVFFTGWTFLTFLGPAALLQLVGRSAGILFVLTPLLGLVAVLLVVGVAWWILVSRWLPANESKLDLPIERVRRQWAAIHVAYGLVLLVLYQVVTLVLAVAIFQPF